MPKLKTYNLFLSHVWRHTDNSEYYRLEYLLRTEPNFKWNNYSVPLHDPLETKTDKELSEALDRQIRSTHCFLVISGMYVNYRKWIRKEVEIAVKYGKPIIGIKPRGQQRVPLEIKALASEMVNWQGGSVVEAIRRHSI